MSILGDVLGLWKSWAEREGKTRKEIADYLDTVAQEATKLADVARDVFGAKPSSADFSRLEIATAQYCSVMKAVYEENASVVLTKHPEVRESLLERVARVRLAPTSLKDQMNELNFRKPDVLTGVDRLSIILTSSTDYRELPAGSEALAKAKLKDAVVALNEEAGELRQLAATYRSAGKVTRTKSKR
jgi:hypothetical protein